MAEPLIFDLGLIVILGIGASWIAWRFHLPSILLLLITGFLVGPVTGIIDPDALFGRLLLPVVELSVAIILFEGALSLRIIELEKIGRVVRNLITIGVAATWLVTVVAAHLIVGLNIELSFLLGAVLVVTGPTVIIPILRHLRPKAAVGNALKWEGILIDPIGVILAVLTFEAILAGGVQQATTVVALTIGKSLLVDVVAGVAGGMFIYLLLRKHWIPDVLQNPMTLLVVLSVFLIAENFQSQSGLAAVTIMGVVLANQRDISIRHILEFKENLRVLFISVVFILLAARLEFADLYLLGVPSFIFLAVLILVARPLGVLISTWGSEMGWRERTFLASMAPRGIVAAAVSSIFAIRLADEGYAQAEMLVPLTFLVIIGTVAIYGLGASPLSRWLKVATPNPQGVMIVGAHPWARKLGTLLDEAGLPVLMVDTNRRNLQEAWDQGLRTYNGSTLSDTVLEEIELEGIGHLISVTPNDEINTLTGLHFLEVFERSNTYQLPPAPGSDEGTESVPQPLKGRLLFEEGMTYGRIRDQIEDGWSLEKQEVDDEETVEALTGEDARSIPLALLQPNGNLVFYTVEERPVPSPGDTLIYLAPPE